MTSYEMCNTESPPPPPSLAAKLNPDSKRNLIEPNVPNIPEKLNPHFDDKGKNALRSPEDGQLHLM